MTLVEHLEELRYRLVVSIVAIAIGAIVGWFLFDRVVDLLLKPYCDYLADRPAGAARDAGAARFFFTGALDPRPDQAQARRRSWGCSSPCRSCCTSCGRSSSRASRSASGGSRSRSSRARCFLFALGALFAYWTLPKALGFLLGFAGSSFVPLLTGDRFLTFVMLVALAFGLSFEFPIVLVFLDARRGDHDDAAAASGAGGRSWASRSSRPSSRRAPTPTRCSR